MLNHVYVITVVQNYLSHTKRLLRSLKQQTYHNITIIVVDDNSQDKTRQFIQRYYPKVVLLHGDGNLWWTAGLNHGMQYAMTQAKQGDFILTINNDSYVKPSYIQHIVNTSIQYNRSVIGSIEVGEQDKKIHTGYLYVDWVKGNWINLTRDDLGILPVDYLMTKGTLFPIETIKTIGSLNNNYLPHYGSDIEYTHRAKQNGYEVLLDPACKVESDIKRTGIELKKGTMSIQTMLSLMFSRKSTINLVDHYHLIRLVCPQEYQLKNYMRLISKALYLMSLTWISWPMRKIYDIAKLHKIL